MKGWHDGQLEEIDDMRVPVTDRGLQFGEGLYETMRTRAGEVPLLPYHLDRFEHACRELELPFPGRERIRKAIRATLQANHGTDESKSRIRRFIIKLLLTGGPGDDLYRKADPEPRLFVLPRPFPRSMEKWKKRGAECRFVPAQGASGSSLARLKTLSRLGETLAMEAVRDDRADAFREALFVDEDRHLLQGTRTNVFVHRDGIWYTPPVTEGLLPGVARRVLLEESSSSPVEERLLFTTDVQEARHVMLTNAVTGPVPVRNIVAPSLLYTERSPAQFSLPPTDNVLAETWRRTLRE